MHRQAKSLLANAGYKTGYNLACAEGNDKPRLSQTWILDGYFGNHSPFLGFVPGFSRYTWPSHDHHDPDRRTGSKLDQGPRRVSAASPMKWDNGSGAKSFADHGRWKVDDLRAGSIRGFITFCEQTLRLFESDHHQFFYTSNCLQGFAAFSCASYILVPSWKKYEKTIEIPMIWALLWFSWPSGFASFRPNFWTELRPAVHPLPEIMAIRSRSQRLEKKEW